MALMLRETVNETSGEEVSHLGSSLANQNAGMSNALVPHSTNMSEMQRAAHVQAQQQEINEDKMNPQELGQVIVNLQDEIKIIKLQLENLPGYDIGKSFDSMLTFLVLR